MDCLCSRRSGSRLSSQATTAAKCLLLDGTTATLASVIEQKFRQHESILISNADVVLHESYGSPSFWLVRRSMRFAAPLIQAANDFRSRVLGSDDRRDKTEREADWRAMRRAAGDAIGGPFVSLHWRRADFALLRRRDVPGIACTAVQVAAALASSGLPHRLFLATDASEQEIDQLVKLLQASDIEVQMFRKRSSDRDSEKGSRSLPQGQEAVIEQWICAHARLFIGKRLLSRAVCSLYAK